MNRKAFKERMQSLKSYRELNPDKGYWDWKVLAFDGGGDVKKQLEIKDPPAIKSHATQLDNVSDYRPIVVELRIERKPKDGEVVHYDVHGNRYVYTPTNAKIIADTRTQYQKERDLENATKAAQAYTDAKNKEKALKTVGTLGLLVSPSTYVGPVFGDKSYAEGVVSGEGFGDISTNILADTFMFGLASGLKNQVSEQIALRDAFKFVDDVPVNSSVKPKIRTKLGDIEIDNPQLYYRQGSKGMANDFLKTGVVNAKGGFTNPLFAKGNLWYGIPDEHSLKPSSVFVTNERGVVFDLTKSNESVPKTHLLVSNAPMEAANKHSSFIPITIKNTQPYPIKDLEMKSWENINMLDEAVSYNTAYYRGDLLPITTRAVDRSGGRRIPAFEGAANKNNTELYEFIPGYGYKHVNQTSKVVPAYTDGTDGNDEKLYIGRTDQDYYGNLTHNIVVDANGDEINFGLPDIVITPKNNLSLGTYNYNKEVARNVADAVSFVPGVGEVIDATVAAQDASKGDYTTAAGLGLGLFIPNVIEKPLKWLWKGGKGFVRNLWKSKTKDPFNFNIEFEPIKPDPMSLEAKPISSETKYDVHAENNYLDYGFVQTEPDLFKPVPDWMKDVIEFYNKDVATREHKYDRNIYRFISSQRYKQTFNETNPIQVIEPIEDTKLGGYFDGKHTVVIRKPHRVRKNFDPDVVVVHEGAHKDQDEYFNNLVDNMSETELLITNLETSLNIQYASDMTYPADQKKLLNEAYSFHKEPDRPLHYLMEKGASNREMRYVLWKENGKPNVEELNKIIDNMSDDDLSYLLSQENAYTASFWGHIKQSVDAQNRHVALNKIRDALKYVPFLTIPILLNAAGEQE